MKSGIENSVGIVDVVVTEEMTAKLDDLLIHPVYSTFWLVYHAELAARRAIEPYFDDEDNAVGSSIRIDHKAMAGVGAHVRITARVIGVNGRHILCAIEVLAAKTNTLLAEGTQGQIFMSKSRLAEKSTNAVR